MPMASLSMRAPRVLGLGLGLEIGLGLGFHGHAGTQGVTEERGVAMRHLVRVRVRARV